MPRSSRALRGTWSEASFLLGDLEGNIFILKNIYIYYGEKYMHDFKEITQDLKEIDQNLLG